MIKALVIGDQDTAERLSASCGDADIIQADGHVLQKELRSAKSKPHVVVLDGQPSINMEFLQLIGTSDSDVSVIILADQHEVTALRQRIVFLPFRLTEVSVIDRAHLEKLPKVLEDHATRTEQRRSYQKLQATIAQFTPGNISSTQIRDSFLGHFMDEASTGAILLNAREEVIYLNKKARELLPALKIAPPKTFFDHFPGEYGAELRASMNKPYAVEPFAVRMADGEEIHLKFKLTSHRDLQDSVYHIIIIYDVTDSVVQARVLEDRIKERNEFIAILSHDLKNPISSLVMSAQTLAESIDTLEKDDVQQLARVIDNSSRQLLKQFDQLVEWARTRQDMTFKPEPLKLRRRVDDALKLVAELARNKDLEVHNEIGHDVVVLADPNMVRSIFQNLVTNAIKFTPDGGTISIGSKPLGRNEEITVKDEGVGMAGEVKEKILNNEITSTAGTRNEPGTGLGLPLVKEFISRHSGRFQIKSAEGKGTSVIFTLPRHAS